MSIESSFALDVQSIFGVSEFYRQLAPDGATAQIIESVLLSRINVEQRNDNNQHQAFHEEEEAWNENVVFVVRIRVSDKGSQCQSRRQPDELSFGVPHDQ